MPFFFYLTGVPWWLPEQLSSIIAGKVVHEVNTPLSIVKNYLNILGRNLAEENFGQEELRIINEEIDRVALMLSKLSDFSEPKVQPTDALDINALLSDVTRILQESLVLGPNIGVDLNLEPLLPELTRQLLGFARGGKYEVKPTDLNELIKRTSDMFGRTKKEIAIHTKYQKDIWAVEVDQGQIEQVLLNLYVNAWLTRRKSKSKNYNILLLVQN